MSQFPITSNPSVHQQLMRIEKAYYYDPGDKMSAVHTISGMIAPRLKGDSSNICLVCGNGNRPLAEAVALLLGTRTHHTSVTQYAGGEVNVRINESVLGAHVYIIQSIAGNQVVDVNTALVELLILIRKMRLSNAKSITALVPYFGYARQDRKPYLRCPISASAVAKMITKMSVDRITTLDLHSHQIQGFFENKPLDNLQMCQEFAQHLRDQAWFEPENMVIVSPDGGGVERARKLADILNIGRIVTIVKRSIKDGSSEILQTVGEVESLSCVIVDDICDTGKTLVNACQLLKELGALRVSALVTHGLFTGECYKRINECDSLMEVVVSDSIPQEEHLKRIPKLKVLTIAPLIATVIDKYSRDESVSSLFCGPLKASGSEKCCE